MSLLRDNGLKLFVDQRVSHNQIS